MTSSLVFWGDWLPCRTRNTWVNVTTTNSDSLCTPSWNLLFFTNLAPQPVCYHDTNPVLSKGFFHLRRFLQRSLLWSLEDVPLHCCGKTTCKSLPSLKLTKMPRKNRQFPPKGSVIGQTYISRFYFSFSLGKFLKPIKSIKLSSTILYNIEATFRQLPASAVPSGHGVTWCHMLSHGVHRCAAGQENSSCPWVQVANSVCFFSPTKGKLKHKCRIDV